MAEILFLLADNNSLVSSMPNQRWSSAGGRLRWLQVAFILPSTSSRHPASIQKKSYLDDGLEY